MIFQMTEPQRTEERERERHSLWRDCCLHEHKESKWIDLILLCLCFCWLLFWTWTKRDDVCKAVKMVRYRVYNHMSCDASKHRNISGYLWYIGEFSVRNLRCSWCPIVARITTCQFAQVLKQMPHRDQHLRHSWRISFFRRVPDQFGFRLVVMCIRWACWRIGWLGAQQRKPLNVRMA